MVSETCYLGTLDTMTRRIRIAKASMGIIAALVPALLEATSFVAGEDTSIGPSALRCSDPISRLLAAPSNQRWTKQIQTISHRFEHG